jgi:Cd2+/Zn2+-exporting ATPase
MTIFDKTGTLSVGEPRLVEAIPLNGLGEAELLKLSAVAEKFSEHPIGRAIVRAARERGGIRRALLGSVSDSVVRHSH